MSWSNVKLILGREIRDQLRDRRTLFMIVVLPLLLYPLLGLTFFQISQFLQEKPSSVLVIGASELMDMPPLFENQRFARNLFADTRNVRLLEVHFAPAEPSGPGKKPPDLVADARTAVQAGDYDAALYFPPAFAGQVEALRQAIEQKTPARGPAAAKIPSPEIIFTTANEKSQVAFARLSVVLDRWTRAIGQDNLSAGGVPAVAAKPFELRSADLAETTGRRGLATWAKILPVLLLLWALTGAFYPAVDLCAGEKERGTLETLLSSPAERSEIVVGKLLTVMLFSLVTAVLNLASLGVTGKVVLAHLPELGLPPASAIVWLVLALIPVSALFSALCLALAAFARSTKEGQYYLMPLLLVTMPLVILPMAPGIEINLGNSLIPVTGVVLLLRTVLEGHYWQAVEFLLPVLGVTLCGCLLAIRWAVDQFNQESVLFRESERLDLGLWLQHLLRDRQPTPSLSGAVFCGVVILMVKFFMSFALPMPSNFHGLAMLIVVSQLVVIATPALLMTIMLTSSPRQTLLLGLPPSKSVGEGVRLLLWRTGAAVLLAVALHPAVNVLQVVVAKLYPIGDELASIQALFKQAPSVWALVLLLAALPAVCEELAFRGFILSGFRHIGHKWQAIAFSAVLFGVTHMILQQSLLACLVGVVIGYVAVQSGSILPCIGFHLVHNTLGLATMYISREFLSRWSIPDFLVAPPDGVNCIYRWPLLLASVLVSLLVLAWFSRQPHSISDEERLTDAIRQGLLADAGD